MLFYSARAACLAAAHGCDDDGRVPTDRVKAVVFDVGNTLWFEARRPDPVEVVRMQAAHLRPLLDEWGVAPHDGVEQVLRDVWLVYEAAWQVQWRRRTYREPSLPSLITGALAARGVDISDEQARAWWRAAWVSERHFGVQLYPDVLDVLRELKQAGLLVGINTNRPCTWDMHLPGLHDMGIASYVDAGVCSGDTGYLKPHPSTFKLVLEKLAVAPHEAVMVGDLAEADMRGAKAVGMRTVWKLNGRYDLPPCPDADHQIHDLAELLALPLFARGARRLIPDESPMPHEDGNADRY